MMNLYKHHLKRLIDFICSLIALVIFIPVMILIILLLLITGHKSLFFVQKRVGYQEKIFRLIKFKTMTEEKDKNGILLPDEKRLTNFGKILRKTSLDELPQLLNVLKGDMSLIGPRPLLIEYLPLYSERQKKRHMVRPGISGWAQVNGRNAISWQQKFEYDVWYVENLSFNVDVKIIYKTLIKVFKTEGITQEGNATVEPFKGNLN
jgi:lipopolysaccharide/colanic/teichoic acid biosynthesis glycosyltransferase